MSGPRRHGRIGTPVADLWAGRAEHVCPIISARLDWRGVLRGKVGTLTPAEVVEGAHAQIRAAVGGQHTRERRDRGETFRRAIAVRRGRGEGLTEGRRG